MIKDFSENGYTRFKAAIPPQLLSRLQTSVEDLRLEHSFSGGLRRLTTLSASLARAISECSLQNILDQIDLPRAFLVRSILFDKTPDSNWKVAWHQDTKIPVRARLSREGFTAWSLKDGIHHAQPPSEVLAGMRTLRIHLDPTPAENGALRVIPGSHRNGFLSSEEIRKLAREEVSCECAARDILAMSPLLLHASSPSQKANHRRVIHLEYANQPLPAPLEWTAA